MATIAMPHIGLGGHLPPAARLGGVLVRQGHTVIAWAPERYRSQIEATGAEFRAHEPAFTPGPFPSLVEFAAVLAEATERCAPAVIEELFSARVDLVIHDVHVPWARVAADFLGVPRIVSNPLFPWREGGAGGGLARNGIAPAFAQPLGRVERSRSAIARRWGVDLGGWWTTVTSPGRTVLSFTTEEVLGPDALPAGWRCVGPLISRHPGCPAPGRALIYVAFGTFFSGRPGPFRAAIEGLADEPVDVVVSTGRGGVDPRQLEPLPANVTVHEFVASREVLSQASVHVTHGGGSSVHEALIAGVPMVCVPQGSDQAAWSRCVERLGAGRIVEEAPDAIRRAVRALLEDEGPRRRAAEAGERLARYDGEAQVATVVGEALAGAAVASG